MSRLFVAWAAIAGIAVMSFPADALEESELISLSEEHTKEICDEFGWLQFWFCNYRMKTREVNDAVLRLVDETFDSQRRPDWDDRANAQDLLLAARGVELDSDVFYSLASYMVVPQYWPNLVRLMANRDFDESLVEFCAGKPLIGALTNPFQNSRHLKIEPILDCVDAVGDFGAEVSRITTTLIKTKCTFQQTIAGRAASLRHQLYDMQQE